MEKIISLFQRNYDGDRLVRNEVVPGAEWVLAGEGVPTIKLDGTCCLVYNGKLFKRYELKDGKKPPENFVPATEKDPNTGKTQGWVPVGDGPDDKWHREAWEYHLKDGVLPDGTYELIGPKVQGNPQGTYQHTAIHQLVNHNASHLIATCTARDYEGIRAYLETANIEGLVWHHPDGRMVKIKRRDFGFAWPSKSI